MLEFKNIYKKYGNKTVLNDISFSAKKGEIVCILGPSGCGKTTALQAIGGFVSVDNGQIIVDGEDITTKRAEEREVATVFQSYGLFPNKTVLENIIYGLKFRKIRKKEAIKIGMEMLETLNLQGFGYKSISNLSGGEQQRVAIGRSLIIKPKLLLLDEPFSNLDTNLKNTMRKELMKIRDIFGITTLFVTHDQEDAFSIADKIVLLNNGVVEQIDTAREIYRNPRSRFALEFIGSSNYLEEEGCYIRPECIVADKNGEKGIIEHKVFKGAFIEYELNVGGNKYLMVALSSNYEFKVGDTINVKLERRII